MPHSTLQVPPPLALCPFLRLQPDQISFSSFNPLCSLSPLSHRTCCSAVLSAWNTLLPPSQSRSYSSFSSQLTHHFLWEAFRDLPGWAECLSSVPTIPYSSPTTELSTLVWKFLITGSSPLPLGSLRAGTVSYSVFYSPSSPCPYWQMADIQQIHVD